MRLSSSILTQLHLSSSVWLTFLSLSPQFSSVFELIFGALWKQNSESEEEDDFDYMEMIDGQFYIYIYIAFLQEKMKILPA